MTTLEIERRHVMAMDAGGSLGLRIPFSKDETHPDFVYMGRAYKLLPSFKTGPDAVACHIEPKAFKRGACIVATVAGEQPYPVRVTNINAITNNGAPAAWFISMEKAA